MKRSPSAPLASLLAAAAVIVSLCAPGRDALARRRAPAASGPLAPTVSGLVVAVDPQTGQLVAPSREQLQQLSAMEQHMLSRSDVGLVQHRLANGAVLLDLDGRFQEFVNVRIGPGGKKTYSCLDNAPALRRALRPDAAGVRSAGRDEHGLEMK